MFILADMRAPCAMLLLLLTAGCGQQDYRIISAGERDQLLDDSLCVVDATITDRRSTFTTPWTAYLLFFLPVGSVSDPPGNDAVLQVDCVLKGNFSEQTLALNDFRELRAAERPFFPYPPDIRNHLRVRVGFDHHRFGRLTSLKIVPLGNTKAFEEALQKLQNEKARRTGSPTSQGAG